MKRKDTKQLLLDSAERLFARHGFYGASMRNITKMAGANLSAVNYYFGSKEALLEAVFERRLVPLNKERTERLEAVSNKAKKAGRRPAVRDALKAFIEPTLRFKDSGDGAKDFISLISRSITGQDDSVRKLFLMHVAPTFAKLITVLREAIPDMPEKKLLWRLHFGLGALFHTMNLCSGSLHAEFKEIELKDKNFREIQKMLSYAQADTDTLIEMLTSFIASGMEAS